MTVTKWAHSTPLCPSLGLAYVAASIRKAGYCLRCVDAIGEAPFQRTMLEDSNLLSYGLTSDQIVEQVADSQILGVSLMFSYDWPLTKSIIQAVHRANPRITIICGGEHINAAPEFCLEDCPEIDFCVLGEGEETIVDLLGALRKDGNFADVAGIAYRNNHAFVRTAPRARIRALEQIPWPAWDLFPLENYLANGFGYGVNAGRTVPILASRGCPFQCTFCSNPQMWTTRWQARNTQDVIQEMQHYIDHYKAENFDFYDLTAIVRKDWVVDFCKKIINKKWSITWQMPAGTRSEALDAEALHWMSLSGQKIISYAPESGSPETLVRIKKKVHLDRMQKSMKAALKGGMKIKLNMIMGFPHETKKELWETIFFLVRVATIGVHDAYIACFSPYPGSELFEDLRKSGKIKVLNNEYFFKLSSYSDLRYSQSYSPYLSNRQLTLYRLGGMMIFYAVSYLLHPLRLFKVIANFVRGREETRMDLALHTIKDRFFSKSLSAAPDK